MSVPPVRGAGAVRMLGAGDVADLVAATEYPCISILMPTEPAATMRVADVTRLHELAAEADRQLADRGVPGRARMIRRLAELVHRAAGEPTDRGIALYVNPRLSRRFRVSVPVTAQSVVERTFATRALFTSLHRMPPHVLLVLHAGCAHLYQGGDGRLRSVGQRNAFRGTRGAPVPRQRDEAGTDPEDGLTRDFLDGVDRMLGAYRAEHPSPLVLGGSPHLVDRFCASSRHLDRLAGRLPADAEDDPESLARASTTAVERYLRSRRDEAMGQLWTALASRPGDVARGIDECWQAVHQRSPGMLLVEEDLVHDAVDDLLELVIMRGGQLALVEPGDLAAHGRVALVSRPTESGPGRRTRRG